MLEIKYWTSFFDQTVFALHQVIHMDCSLYSTISKWNSDVEREFQLDLSCLQVGAVGLLFVGIIATHCMIQLVSCARELYWRYTAI